MQGDHEVRKLLRKTEKVNIRKICKMDIMEEEAVTSERIGGNEVDLMSSKFGWPEYLVFGLMLAISAGIGLFYAYQGRRKNTTGEFLLGGRQMGTFPIAASLMAS